MQDFPLAGFRFYPTEEELVGFYLHNQLHGHKQHEINKVIPLLDINGIEPWNLPTLAGERCRGETEQWFFFSPRQEREARGGRPNRTTATGYWKATGSPSHVYSSNNGGVIGIKKTMVFYTGKAPSGNKTKWKMHEYKAIQHSHQSNTTSHPPKLRHEFSLCRVYVISGSFGSFDRRPRLNNELQQLEGSNNNRGKQVPAAADRLSSTSSGGGRGDHGAAVTTAHDNSQVGEPSGTNWDAVNNTVETEVEESLWEWDQLNWL